MLVRAQQRRQRYTDALPGARGHRSLRDDGSSDGAAPSRLRHPRYLLGVRVDTMTPGERDAYFIGWLGATYPAIQRTADAVSAYGDAFPGDERFRQMKDAADHLRRAARILSALETLADADSGESNRRTARTTLEIEARHKA